MNAPPLWISVFVWAALATGFYLIEKPHARNGFPISFWGASFIFLAATSIALTGGAIRGALLWLCSALLINAISKKKHSQTGISLVPDDISLLLTGGLIVLWRDYRAYILPTVLGVLLAAFIFLLVARSIPDIEVPALWRWEACLISALSLLVTYSVLGGSSRFGGYPADGKHRICTFLSSCISRRQLFLHPHNFTITDVAADSLALPAVAPLIESTARPDIVLIHHESVFDPRLFGLPVKPEIEAFLSPAGLSGRLRVHIFGGSSWQTEFSIITGLPSTSFGLDANHVFSKGAGRFQSTLQRHLAGIGYHPVLASSYDRHLLGYDRFYASAGIEDRIFADDFGPAFERRTLQQEYDDALFYNAVLSKVAERDAGQPLMLMALTNYNHAPHIGSRGNDAKTDEAHAYALAVSGNPEYAEYYRRLTKSAKALQDFQQRYTKLRPGRPVLFIRYGDHQPAFTRKLKGDHFTTFYAIEAHGFALQPAGFPIPDPLDVAFLSTLALKVGGVPLDALGEARLQLMQRIGSDYLGTPSEERARLHRTMINEGMMRVDVG